MPWGFNDKGAHEIPETEVQPRRPAPEEAAHLPTEGFASHTYDHSKTHWAAADESRIQYRLS